MSVWTATGSKPAAGRTQRSTAASIDSWRPALTPATRAAPRAVVSSSSVSRTGTPSMSALIWLIGLDPGQTAGRPDAIDGDTHAGQPVGEVQDAVPDALEDRPDHVGSAVIPAQAEQHGARRRVPDRGSLAEEIRQEGQPGRAPARGSPASRSIVGYGSGSSG